MLGTEAQPARWGGVFAMTLCVFALIASEFMPVSLLTPMAVDLGVSEGWAGQGIAVSGAFAVLTSLRIAALAGKMDRKTLLLGLTVLMCVSGAVIALAPNYAVYMAGRALIGVVVGGFWSMSAATAMRLVPAQQVPRALAIFNGGNALATVVAAPLGSYLGAAIGWRGAFWCLVPVAVVAFVWQWVSLPAMPAERQSAGESGRVFGLLRRRAIALGMWGVGSFFMGQFVLFTYLRPFLETVAHVGGFTLSFILLVIGVAGFVGTALVSVALDKGFYRTLFMAPVLMAFIAIALIFVGDQLTVVTALLGVWGLVATAAPVGWWTWVARSMPDAPEAGGGLMVAVVQLAIGLGATVGGLLFDSSGYQTTFAVSAILLLGAALLVFLTWRAGLAHGHAVTGV
ncbi:putative MFS family arabinose efflux permease [Acidovorax sp. 69]|uniref:MFS transporter n=1 Tax=Acidovorax sp. 69 TaxID=2035202 RepID=UPI000CB555CA|nr:MFS transporter [Acidovorax sp. 69]PJI97852.1 putative MFS family arabinose efflux permease [Acidovorax sp. 69]